MPARLAPPAEPGGDTMLAMLAALREPALLHGERIEAVNDAFSTLVGVPPAELAGKTLAELVSAEYAELVALAVTRVLAGEANPALTEVEVADSHGQVTRLELTGSAIDSAGRKLVLFTAEEMLPHREGEGAGLPPARSQLALDSLGEGLLTTDAHGLIDYLNPSAETLTGIRREDAVGQAFGAMLGFVDEHDRRALADPVQQCLATGSRVNLGRRSILISRATGGELGVEATASPIRGPDGDVSGVAVMLHDVSELRGLTQQMSYQASHDALTGLVNRREFERRLGEALEIARAGRQGHVMCYLDLDRFKAVNDTSGHLAGDNMLREVASLIREAVRDSDTVARLGGDEFGVLLVGCPLEKARQIADDILRAIAEYRFIWKDRIFSVGVSIGIVELTGESNSLEEILTAADSACYVAKKQGDSHVHVYSSHDEVVARSRGEIQWLQRLQAALRDGFFELYIQPIEPTRPNSTGGPAMEVFVRLHDEGHAILPAEFFPAAERYRLMSMIDRWVLGSALAAISAGAIRLPPGRSLSINVSGQTLADPTFLEFVVDELDRTGVAARADLLRGRGDRCHRQPRAGAPVHRCPARHGLPLCARRLRHRPRRLREPEAAADGLPQDRRLVHARPGPRFRQPGDGERGRRHGAQPELPAGGRADRGRRRARGRARDGHRLRAGPRDRPAAAAGAGRLICDQWLIAGGSTKRRIPNSA